MFKRLFLVIVLSSIAPAALCDRDDLSFVEIPFEVDLGPVYRRAEALVPRRIEDAASVRYQAWRGPLALSMNGNLMTVVAHVRYRIQARKSVLGDIALKADCGVREPPRQAIVAVSIRLDWSGDWTLRPAYRLFPTRFIDRCRVTPFGIDVTGMVDRGFKDALHASMRDAMGVLSAEVRKIREPIERQWQRLQRPVEVAPGLWLVVDPVGMMMAPPLGQGRRLTFKLGVLSRPRLTTQVPMVRERALPPLRLYMPHRPGMRFDLHVDLDVAQVTDKIGANLTGRAFEIEGRRVTIDRMRLTTAENELIAIIGLGGGLKGELDVRGRPSFDRATSSLRFDDFDYVYRPAVSDPDPDLMIGLYYEPIRLALLERADTLLADSMAELADRLGSAWGTMLASDRGVDLGSIRLANLAIRLREDRIELSGQAVGGPLAVWRP